MSDTMITIMHHIIHDPPRLVQKMNSFVPTSLAGNKHTKDTCINIQLITCTSALIQFLHGMGMPNDGFASNLDDYVFSQDALDQIMTQLMNQSNG